MKTYHKIQTIFKRNPNNMKELLMWEWTLPEFEYLSNNIWVWSEKIDGTNIRIDWDLITVTFGGRTDRAQIPKHLLEKLEELFPLALFQEAYPETPMTLYGEGYGVKIQRGGKYIPDGVNFILFDVMIDAIWLERHNVEDIGQVLGIDVVPIVGFGTIKSAIEYVQGGFNSYIADTLAEGLVIRPKVEMLNRRGNRIITKIKHRDFN